MPKVELVFFEGCPHVAQARENIRAAGAIAGFPPDEVTWSEWDLRAETTPASYRRHGSPTVLVDGTDVTGDAPDAQGMACRAGGAPAPGVIAARLR